MVLDATNASPQVLRAYVRQSLDRRADAASDFSQALSQPTPGTAGQRQVWLIAANAALAAQDPLAASALLKDIPPPEPTSRQTSRLPSAAAPPRPLWRGVPRLCRLPALYALCWTVAALVAPSAAWCCQAVPAGKRSLVLLRLFRLAKRLTMVAFRTLRWLLARQLNCPRTSVTTSRCRSTHCCAPGSWQKPTRQQQPSWPRYPKTLRYWRSVASCVNDWRNWTSPKQTLMRHPLYRHRPAKQALRQP